jgi:hypothetical protein
MGAMDKTLFRDACNELGLERARAITYLMWLKDKKHLVSDIDTLEVLTYPMIIWKRMYEEFLLSELGY